MAFCFLGLQLGIARTAAHKAKDPIRLTSYIYPEGQFTKAFLECLCANVQNDDSFFGILFAQVLLHLYRLTPLFDLALLIRNQVLQ